MREQGFSGNQIHALAVRDFLLGHGWDAKIITPFHGSGLFRTAVFGFRYLLKTISHEWDIVWHRYGHFLYLKSALQQEVRAEAGACVIYAQDPPSAEAALQARRPGVDKVVMVVHFNDSQADEWVQRGSIRKGGRVYKDIAALEEKVLAQVDHVVYVSDYMKGRLEARIPSLQSVPNTVVPNFVEIPKPAEATHPNDLIAIGTLEPRKNQGYILQVLAELRKRGLVVSLTLVGDGPDRASLEAMARELNLQEQITFAGYVPSAAGWIHGHKLLVHAAHIENCPISLIEALAVGVPVVAAHVGGIPEVISVDTGSFWDLSSAKDGADHVQRFLEQPNLLATAQHNASQRYQTHFAPEVTGAKLMRLFQSLLDG